MAMKLSEFITLVDRRTGSWYPGWEEEERNCAVSLSLTDVCAPNTANGLITNSVPAEPSPYAIVPFASTARIDRKIPCAADDEEKWLIDFMREDSTVDTVVGRALCVQHATGAETWIGDTQVTEFTATANIHDDVADARMTWTANNGGQPALHVADNVLPGLVVNGVVAEDGQTTVWGDTVVASSGYLPGVAFWSGPITAYADEPQVDIWVDAPSNSMAFNGTRMYAVDMAPCSVVRIGAAPTDPSPLA
jgi:hypothetical protein